MVSRCDSNHASAIRLVAIESCTKSDVQVNRSCLILADDPPRYATPPRKNTALQIAAFHKIRLIALSKQTIAMEDRGKTTKAKNTA